MSSASTYSLTEFPDVNQRGAFTIYCDDIRNEVGGKSTFVGVFGSEMIVPSFPALLPKFVVHTTVWTTLALPFHKISLRILLNEEVISQEDIDIAKYNALNEESEKNNNITDPMARRVLVRIAQFSPFLIEKESVLRVRVQTEDGELRTAGLRIRAETRQDAK